MSLRPKQVSDFDPCSQAPTGRDVDPTTHTGFAGNGKPKAMKAHNPDKDGSAKNHGSYPKNAQKLRG